MPESTAFSAIAAIDVHAHYGRYLRNDCALTELLMTADAATVAARARLAGTAWTIVSPLAGLFPRAIADSVTANDEASRTVSETDGLLQWVIVNPLQPRTYEQAKAMLLTPHCVGIKIHPEEHVYPISKWGEQIFRFAAQNNAVVLCHTGEANSMPGNLVKFADEFPEMRLVLAHLGCGWDGDLSHQVRAIQASQKGNVFVDTSSASSVVSGLIEWAVREVGAHRILYGSDTPLYFAPMQRARIEHAELEESDRRRILRDNAVALFDVAKVEARVDALKRASAVAEGTHEEIPFTHR